jgi:L-idonate 5-dehydrogenase
MRGVIIHGAKDLRIEEVAPRQLGPRDVRVRIEAGGICGSDLHYYHHGGFGTVRLKQAMALGHEIAGTVEEVGSDVSRVSPGTRVAVNPSQPCNECRYCCRGQHNQCLDMRFMGSAMRFPHVQGGFRQSIAVDESQAVPIPPTMTMSEAAMAEPLAVCLHALSRQVRCWARRCS